MVLFCLVLICSVARDPTQGLFDAKCALCHWETPQGSFSYLMIKISSNEIAIEWLTQNLISFNGPELIFEDVQKRIEFKLLLIKCGMSKFKNSCYLITYKSRNVQGPKPDQSLMTLKPCEQRIPSVDSARLHWRRWRAYKPSHNRPQWTQWP